MGPTNREKKKDYSWMSQTFWLTGILIGFWAAQDFYLHYDGFKIMGMMPIWTVLTFLSGLTICGTVSVIVVGIIRLLYRLMRSRMYP